MRRRIREVKNNQSGFTLIELLIVIVILGILAAVVVFAVGAFNKNGQQAACKSDFKSVEIADEAFFAKSANSTYAATQADLVPTYLKEWPTNTAYTVALTAGGPTVTVGANTTTNDAACTALSS